MTCEFVGFPAVAAQQPAPENHVVPLQGHAYLHWLWNNRWCLQQADGFPFIAHMEYATTPRLRGLQVLVFSEPYLGPCDELTDFFGQFKDEIDASGALFYEGYFEWPEEQLAFDCWLFLQYATGVKMKEFFMRNLSSTNWE